MIFFHTIDKSQFLELVSWNYYQLVLSPRDTDCYSIFAESTRAGRSLWRWCHWHPWGGTHRGSARVARAVEDTEHLHGRALEPERVLAGAEDVADGALLRALPLVQDLDLCRDITK